MIEVIHWLIAVCLEFHSVPLVHKSKFVVPRVIYFDPTNAVP